MRSMAIGLALVAVMGSSVGAAPPQGPRMTGGGWGMSEDVQGGGPDFRVGFGAELPCDELDGPATLQVNWQQHRFHLEAMTDAECELDAEGRGIHRGEGVGRCDGFPADVHWEFVDGGRDGSNGTGQGNGKPSTTWGDIATFSIDSPGPCGFLGHADQLERPNGGGSLQLIGFE